MHCVFPRIFFILFCISFSRGWGMEEAGSPPPKFRSRTSTMSSVGIDETEGPEDRSFEKPLAQTIIDLKTVFVAWVREHRIDLDRLSLLDSSEIRPKFKTIFSCSNEALIRTSFATLSFPTLTNEVIDAFRRYYALPVIPLFSTMFGGSLDMIHGEMPNEEVERILRDYSYE